MNYIIKYVNVFFDKYYDSYFEDLESLVLGNLNVNLISKNTNNNILIVNYLLNYIWNINLNQFTNIKVNSNFDKYLKSNLKYSNKKVNDKLNIFEYNIDYVNINLKILFIDFRRFKFTEQKYYILFIDYFVNLTTINKFKYIFIINNFDYVLNEFIKNIVVNIEKNNIQFIILTSNNISGNIKGLFTRYNFNNRIKDIDILNDILDTSNLFKLNDLYLESTINFKKIVNLFDNDLYKTILAYLLYCKHLESKQQCQGKIKPVKPVKSIKPKNILLDNNELDILENTNNFLYNDIFNYFISLKYVFNLVDNLILNQMILLYVKENKITKKNLVILTDNYIKTNNNIRNISYLLNSYFITIEEITYIIRYVIRYKINIINTIINFIDNINPKDKTQVFDKIKNILLCIDDSNIKILKLLLHDETSILFNVKEIKNYLMKFNIQFNIETKNKNINNKFNKLLFILNDNNVV